MLDEATIEALKVAQSALLVEPGKRSSFQQACVQLTIEIHRLNGLINDLYADKTPSLPTDKQWTSKNVY